MAEVRLRTARSRALYGIFFLSGVAGLGYQMAWSRMFTVGLGHEIPSVLAVVAAFFAGLALGAWVLDGVVSRSAVPGLWYVGLEVVIGLWGFASVVMIAPLNRLAIELIGLEPSPVWHWMVAFILPMLALLPATTAMGATLPAMERFVAPLTRDGLCVAGLYAVNTAGAVVGTLGSAFIVIPMLGFRAAVMTLAGVNIVCALAVLAAGASSVQTQSLTHEEESQCPLPRWQIGVVVFCTGLLGVGYEVLGIRVMSQVLENTVYSFAAVLSVYLLGTAVGAAIYQRFGRRLPFEALLGYLLTGIATTCMMGTWLMWGAKPVYAYVRKNMFGDGLMGVMASEMTVAAMVFALPTLLMGATFSHLVQGARRVDGGVGWAAAINTTGAALAPLVFGVLLLPAVGVKWALVVVSLGYLPLIPKGAGVRWVVEAVPVLMVLALPQHLQVLTMRSSDKVVKYREGVMATVAVMASADGHHSLRVNNRFQMGDTRGWVTEARQAHLPLLLHGDPRRALFLGLGSAITFRSAGFHPDLEADGVELVPEVVQVLDHFSIANLPADADARLHIYTADARRFVRAADKQYDVIVADLFHPGRDGAGFLYTEDHFRAIRSRLNDGGLFCQWVPLYQLDTPMIRVIVRTFLEVFPHTRAIVVDFKIDHPMLGLVGTTEKVTYDVDWYARRVSDTEYRRFLKGLLLTGPMRLFGSMVADTDDLSAFSDGAEVATDDRPVINFGGPLFTSRQDVTAYGRLVDLLDQFDPHMRGLFLGEPDRAEQAEVLVKRLDRYREARDLFVNGLVLARQGQPNRAYEALILSIETSPDFVTGYSHLLAIARDRSKNDKAFTKTLLSRMVVARPERQEAKRLLSGMK